MRIISLLPAATEWVCALGAKQNLVGRSHACDYPASIQHLPVLTSTKYDLGKSSGEINSSVSKVVQQGLSLYHLDLFQMRALKPDLILTQSQCKVCAVSMDTLESSVQTWVDGQPRLLSVEPMTFKRVLETGLRIGKAVGRGKEAMEFIAKAEKKLFVLRTHMGLEKRSESRLFPKVVCIEWMEPIMTASHWMPDVADLAGGRALLSEKGERSKYVSWDKLKASDPDILAIMPCGFSIQQARNDLPSLTNRDGWSALKAVRNKNVFLFDGNAYFNRPGPRLYRSTELLAAAIRPNVSQELAIQPWEMVRMY